MTIELEAVTKRFSRRPLFEGLSFTLHAGEIVAITGANGSGKSTLMRIIAQILPPTKGKCRWMSGEKPLDEGDVRKRIGFVAPYLELYDELTALEHLKLIADLKGVSYDAHSAADSLISLGLAEDVVLSQRRLRAYSSGMRQRVRFGMAGVGEPEVIMLDEPTTNLDEIGIETVFNWIAQRASKQAIVVLATNDARERSLASRTISL